jgi:hypothetical protein
MNKNKRLATLSIMLFSIATLSACVANNPTTNSTANSAAAATQTGSAKHQLKVIDSNRVTFSKIKVEQAGSGHEVEGIVRLKATQRKILRLPGYITVTLKAADGTEIEKVTAKYHRKFGASKVGHFDAKLTKSISNGSQIIVEHHQ